MNTIITIVIIIVACVASIGINYLFDKLLVEGGDEK